MNKIKSLALAGISVVALLAVSACTDPGIDVPEPGQGTGAANASQPAGQNTVATIETTAPEGGAAARVGDQDTTISRVACTVINGMWSMSGSDDEGTKVAVTGPEDRSAVDTASVVLADGTVAQVMPGNGSASIEWEGETFTVTGRGELINLNDPDASGGEIDFAITATCA